MYNAGNSFSDYRNIFQYSAAKTITTRSINNALLSPDAMG